MRSLIQWLKKAGWHGVKWLGKFWNPGNGKPKESRAPANAEPEKSHDELKDGRDELREGRDGVTESLIKATAIFVLAGAAFWIVIPGFWAGSGFWRIVIRAQSLGVLLITFGSLLGTLGVARTVVGFRNTAVKLPMYLGVVALLLAVPILYVSEASRSQAATAALVGFLLIGLSLMIWRPELAGAGGALLVFVALFAVVYGLYFTQSPASFQVIPLSTLTTGCSLAAQGPTAALGATPAKGTPTPAPNAVGIAVTYPSAMQANDSNGLTVSLFRAQLARATPIPIKRTSVALTAAPPTAAAAGTAIKRTSVALTRTVPQKATITGLKRTSVALTRTVPRKATITGLKRTSVALIRTAIRAVKRTSVALTLAPTKAAKVATGLKPSSVALTRTVPPTASAPTSVAATTPVSNAGSPCPFTPQPARQSTQTEAQVQATPIAVGTPGSRLDTAFGSDYGNISATVALHAVQFKSVPLNEGSQSAAEHQETWGWTVTPRSPGQQVLSLRVAGVWTCVQPHRCGHNVIRRRIWQSDPLHVDVKPPSFFAQITPSVLLPALIPATAALLVPLVSLKRQQDKTDSQGENAGSQGEKTDSQDKK